MKKTLIALAVLAASGATFAQATITGNYTGGWVQTNGGGAGAVAGFGTDTAAVQFNASEDLGGGLKASAKVSIANASREAQGAGANAYVKGEDAFVNLTGGFGSLTIGTVESANGLLAIGSSGASGIGMDGQSISGSTNLDVISYGLPLSSAVTLGASYVDRGAVGSSAGLGVGTTGAAGNQPSFTLGVTYAAGPAAAKFDYTSWSRQDDAAVTSNLYQNRFRLSGAYDMGVARLSAGYSSAKSTPAANTTITETLVGVKVPVGAVVFGLDYAMGTVTGQNDTNGYSLGVAYNLSKRTSVQSSYASWTQRNANFTANAESQSKFRIYVSHSF